MPKDWGYLTSEVDTDGYVIPYEAVIRRSYDEPPETLRQAVQHVFPDQAAYKARFRFYGAGIIPPEVRQGFRDLPTRIQAERHSVIPAWLGENAPMFVVFLPGGDILAYGELGLHYLPQAGQTPPQEWLPPPGETWYRYDSSGKLLGQYMPPADWGAFDSWLELSSPGLPAKIAAASAKAKQANPEYNCWPSYFSGAVAVVQYKPDALQPIVFTRPEVVGIVAAFSYDGTPLDPDQPVQPDAGYYRQEPRDYLERIYRQQVQLGLTKAGVPSPYAGTPRGPVVVGPTPRPRRLFVSKGQGGLIEVRPMDDPANPYRNQYDPWDYWLVEHHAEYEAEFNRQYSEVQDKQRAAVNKLLAEGKEVPAEMLKPVGVRMPQEGALREIPVQVDGSGFIVPQRVVWEEERDREAAYDRRLPWPLPASPAMLGCGGQMPDDLAAKYERAKWEVERTTYPRLPDWLMSQPVFGVIFLPDGSLVTHGPLGCRPAGAEKMDRKLVWAGIERGFFHYSAKGELLDKYLTDGYDWEQMFDPAHNQRIADAKARGLKFDTRDGYLLIMDPVGGWLKEGYDYDGKRLDLYQPLLRPTHCCRYIWWTTLPELYAQQEAAKRE